MLFCALAVCAVAADQDSGRYVLRFDAPAAEWVDGLPLGNGTLGAMVMGGVRAERVALNHGRLWRRSAERRIIRTAAKLPEFRKLFLAGRFEEAGHLMGPDIPITSGKNVYVNPYQPLGDLLLAFEHSGEPAEYTRRLDMDSGIATVTYRVGNVRFEREYFASAPNDGALAIRIRSSPPGAISAKIRLSRLDDPECSVETRAAGNLLTLSGRFREGFPFAAAARVTHSRGKLTAGAGFLDIRGAGEVLIVLAMASGEDSVEPTNAPFNQLLRRHVADHSALFRRVRMSLGSELSGETTEQRVEAAVNAKHTSLRLVEQLFDFGRYLLISGSRPGGLPMNLQGIWNDKLRPPWDSDYHMDLNLEFNYWPAEVSNLPELAAPLFDWVEAGLPEARQKARDLYGCRGIYFPLVADATGLGNPDNICFSWPGNAGWLAQHFWWHWEYTGDRQFLERRAYPLLKEVAAFYFDYLFEDVHGRYRILPSSSPENGIKGRKGWMHYTSISSTIDLEIAREVFTNLVRAGEILAASPEEITRWRGVLEKLPLPAADRAGRLREWSEDVEAEDPAHRHLSPLYGLFPGDRIAAAGTLQVDAARKLFEFRLAAGTGSANGWSYPWRAALFARLREGDRALSQLDEMARCCLNGNLLTLITDYRQQGLSINWFGRQKVFQVEAGLATTAAISEMLLQSHGGVIRILPALPARWPAGRVDGLAARGGFIVGIDWTGGKTDQARILSHLGNTCRISAPPGAKVLSAGQPVKFSAAGGLIEFPTTPGSEYHLSY